MAGRPRLPWAVLGLGLAALASSWNPAAAPFGLVTGLGAALLAARALRGGGGRVAALALAASLLAVALAGGVLALTAGVGRGPGERSLVPHPPPAEAGRALDAAGERGEAARERARGELERGEAPLRRAPAN